MMKIITIKSKNDFDDFLVQIEEESLKLQSQHDYDRLLSILNLVGFPTTIIYESNYVDRVFRDSFYLYYAAKYNFVEKNCKRLSFFKGENARSILLNNENTDTANELLQADFIGFVVIRPIKIGKVGRTILDPTKLTLDKCYVRTTEFSCSIYGHILKLNGFPFSSQDGETMTCAETTIWEIIEYYANRYSDYKIILPSDIAKNLEDISQERILPSSGLAYSTVSRLLRNNGFAPRIYAKEGWQEIDFKRTFHYYIESGIPIAVGISATQYGSNIRHSVVCIGHGKQLESLQSPRETFDFEGKKFPYIDSADLYNDYVIMDDNQIPYKIQPYDKMTLYGKPQICVFAVPLYKRIFLEAQDARKIFLNLMNYDGLSFLNMVKYLEEEINEENPLIFRLFLTSSRKFKSYRDNNEPNNHGRKVYQDIQYPKFIWVAEIFTAQSYQEGLAYGEVVIDATSSRHSSVEESVIMLRYLSLIGYRNSNETIEDLLKKMNKSIAGYGKKFKLYINNLLMAGENL